MSLLFIQLRQSRGGILGWGLGLLVYGIIIGSSYAAFAENEAFGQFADDFPEMAAAFGVDSLTSPDGYWKSQAVALYPLLLGIYGAFAATKYLSGAEERGVLDHLLARPLTRRRYLATAAGALALGLSAILVLAGLGGLLGYLTTDVAAGDISKVFLMTLEPLPLVLAHLAICLFVASWAHTKGPTVAITMAIVVGGYAIDLISKLVSALDWLQYLNLYGYYSRSDWFHGDVDALYLVVMLLVMVAATVGAFWRFDRKDLY